MNSANDNTIYSKERIELFKLTQSDGAMSDEMKKGWGINCKSASSIKPYVSFFKKKGVGIEVGIKGKF